MNAESNNKAFYVLTALAALIYIAYAIYLGYIGSGYRIDNWPAGD